MSSNYLNYNYLKSKIININETENNFSFFKYSKKKDIRKAAVIILIINDNQKQIVFTKRTHLLKNHPNQISFPGGAYEKKDKTLCPSSSPLHANNAGRFKLTDPLVPNLEKMW